MSYSSLTVVMLGGQYERVCLDVRAVESDAGEVIVGNGVSTVSFAVNDDDAPRGASVEVSCRDLFWSRRSERNSAQGTIRAGPPFVDGGSVVEPEVWTGISLLGPVKEMRHPLLSIEGED